MSVRDMRRGWTGILGGLVVCLWQVVAQGEAPVEPGQADAEAQLAFDSRADRLNYDRANGIVEGIGKVIIRRGDVELKADYVRVNVETGDADALGDVTLTRGADVWTGPSLKYNFKTGAGLTSNMKITALPFYVNAESFERSPEGTYILHNAWASTCNPDEGRVDFHVTARKMEVMPNENIKARGAVWWFGGVPTMYMPYWYRDLDNETGFHFVPGYDSKSGAFLLSSYRYRINPGMTGETHVDYRTERGVAGGQDFKWNTGENRHVGNLIGYVADDQEPMDKSDIAEGKDIDASRYRVRYHDQYVVSERDLVLARAHYLSDTDILEDFFEDEFRDERQPDNYASYTHRGDMYSASLVARMRLNDFYENVNRLPEASLDMYRQPIGESDFYYESRTAAGFLQRQFPDGSTEEDYDTLRIDSGHTFYYPDKYFGFLNFVPRAGGRATYYSNTRRSETSIETTSMVDTNGVTTTSTNAVTRDVDAGADMRGVFELGFETSYKAFQTYDTAYGPRRHIVEPFANYTLIPEPNLTPDQLYQFDDVDRVDEQQDVRFGVRQKWQEKRDNGAFDLVDLEVSSILNIHRDEDQDAIESLFWDGEIRPADGWALDTDGRWSLTDGALATMNTWVAYNGIEDLITRVEHRYKRESSNLLIGEVTLFPKARWSYNTYARYEFETSRMEEVGGYIQRIFTCVGLRVGRNVLPGYTREDGVKQDEEYRFLIELWLTAFPESRLGGKHRS